MNNTTLLLHTGLEKTGSTSLQETLFLKHPQVHYLGKVIGTEHIKKACLDDISYRVLNPVLWDLDKPMDTEATLSLFHESLLPLVPKDRVLMGSWENLGHKTTENHLEMLTRTKAIFGACRIMITLRNPLIQLPSLYLQNLRGNFLRQNNGWMDSETYEDIEGWYRKCEMISKNPLLNYSECIRSSIEQLGRENVGIFLFEDLQENPNAYYQSICEFMGIDPEMGVSLTQDIHSNPRLSEAQLAYMRKTKSSLLGRMLHSYSSLERRRKRMEALLGGPPAKVVLTEQLIKEVSDASRDGHRWLVEKLDLPLETHGYPL